MSKPQTLAQKLDWLFTNILHPDGREYTYREVEAGTKSLGKKVAASNIWQLRNGKHENPTISVLRVLAQFFNVPTTYFIADDYSQDELERMRQASLLSDPEVEEVALRFRAMQPKKRKAVLDFFKNFLEAPDE